MLAFGCSTIAFAAPDWTVKKTQFSAVSVGVAFIDDKVGYSSFTNGAETIKVVKTTDGGATFNTVKNQTNGLMVMGMDSSTDPSLDVVVTGMAASQYSTDGDVFTKSKGGPFVSQSIRAYSGGRVVTAKDGGVCVSTDGGAQYTCHTAPVKTPGRYAAAPSEKVLYLTAGEWPSHEKTTASRDLTEVQLSSTLRVTRRVLGLGGARLAMETGPAVGDLAAPPPPPTGGYKAQILKSADGGETWSELFFDSGNFYFNQIDCFDEKTCVAVGEGYGQDGSASPGARVYVTTDGANFTLSHHEQVDGSSLMAASVLSATEHFVGGKLQAGVGLHSSDGGKTYEAQGKSIKGQSITDMSFVSPTHGYATSVNALQICSLLEFGSA